MKLPIVRIQGKKIVCQLLMEIPFTKPQKKFLIGIKYLGSVLINIRLLLSLFLHNCPHHCTKLDEAADSIKMWIILEGGFLTQRLSIEISLRNFYILNTQYMTNSTQVSPVKMEYGWNFSISGLKMMMKSGLEKYSWSSSMRSPCHFYYRNCTFDQNSSFLWGKFI